jgi:hypothetical protein
LLVSIKKGDDINYHFFLVNPAGITFHSGPLNVLPTTLITAGMTLACPQARMQASLIVIAAMYGQVPFFSELVKMR